MDASKQKIDATAKILFPILLLFLVTSCFYKNSEAEKKLIGNWGIYVSVFAGTRTMCNVCPNIYFKGNRNAILTLPSEEEEHYNWIITEDKKLRIDLHDKNIKNAHFDKSVYDFKLRKEEEFDELLISLDDKSGYILRK